MYIILKKIYKYNLLNLIILYFIRNTLSSIDTLFHKQTFDMKNDNLRLSGTKLHKNQMGHERKRKDKVILW